MWLSSLDNILKKTSKDNEHSRSLLSSPWWKQHLRIKKDGDDEHALIVIISLVEATFDMKKKMTIMSCAHHLRLLSTTHHRFF
jgi:hypothetical protein